MIREDCPGRGVRMLGTLGLCTLFLIAALAVSPFFGAEEVDTLAGLNLILQHGFADPLPDEMPARDENQVLRSIVSNRSAGRSSSIG